MISIPKSKKIDLKNSKGYVNFITKDDNTIKRVEINSISDGSPLLDFILNNDPDDTFKELSHDIYIKLIEKNVDLKYCETTNNNLITKTYDMNCPNKTGIISTNHLNYIYYYYPEEKYTYGTISDELLRFAKKYVLEKTEFHQHLFDKFVNVFNKYVIKLLNGNIDTYVICCVPSHEACEKNNNTMSYVIAEVKKKYFKEFFINGSDVITRRYTIAKSSLGEEKRTIERQLNSIEIKHPELINNKTILLIDDFYTSGATMEACKKLLLDNGAKEVILFAFAKTRDMRWHNE
jgi:predicted amidophosphoribosyltransferase